NSRTYTSATLPCRFTLVAAMNPCPCGYAGTPRCHCPPSAVSRYRKRLSGPLLDRIDLYVEVQPLTLEERLAETTGGLSSQLRQKVAAARTRQQQRFQGTTFTCNAAIPAGQILDYCQFSAAGLEQYKQVISQANVSTRLADRLARVARTVADLHEAAEVEPPHVNQAADFVLNSRLNFVTYVSTSTSD
ncbi:MAG: ATP-binding protein, partial [Thermogemmata sp.]|nr:ATP-binding protein [Thermogemmata sp.]